MASVGFGDIIAAGKLANDIYENCFTREQAAGEFPITVQSIQSCPTFQGCHETLADIARIQVTKFSTLQT